jgi:hypothetical protein
MSLAEIEQEITRLSVTEQNRLALFLRALRKRRTVAFQGKIARARREFAAGKGIGQEEVERMHQRLVAQGR